MEGFNLHEQLKFVSFAVVLALIPFVLVLMTSFTRITIVLTFLRQALSTSVPSSQIIIGLSLILTGYIMHPVIAQIQEEAVTPYFQSEEKEKEKVLIERAWPPLRNFMLYHTREKDLALFLDMAHIEVARDQALDPNEIPWFCTIPSFVISELRTAFMMGFLLFLPFLIIDMVITSLLMSMGMVMLPPVMIAFPFKILLFVVVDGWRLVAEQVVHGYQM